MPKRDEVDAAGLDSRAARLMGWEPMDCCCGEKHLWTDPRERRIREPRFTTDLNDAAELFRAAPEDVQHAVDVSMPFAYIRCILDPAALTRAVVLAWEAARTPAATHSKGPETPSNAKGGGNG